ncbi:MAG: hypothetical protein AAF216_05815 [Pseudomonadota bacterium]
MKRAHRRNHILIWFLLAPALVLGLLAAIMVRPAEPVNDVLPVELIGEAD